ncbi:MAG: peptidoglycan-binding domain-containing protein [Longimicrobiales bacterium]
MGKPRDDIINVRQTKEHRYENAGMLYLSLKSPRFRKVSPNGGQRLKEVLNNRPVMVKGERGEAVKVIQQALIDLRDSRIMIPDGATGYFGEQTLAAVVAFQKAQSLVSQNGMVGTETLGRLDELYNRPAAPSGREVELDMVIAPGATSIPRIIQPKGEGSCWAAAAAMAYFWRHHPQVLFPSNASQIELADAQIRYVLSQTKSNTQKWIDRYNLNKGLENALNREFFGRGLGMRVSGGQTDVSLYQYSFWTDLLRLSPVLANTFRIVPGDTGKHNHMIVVYGIKGLRSLGTLMYIDPLTATAEEAPLQFIVGLLGGVPGAPPSTQARERIMTW